MSKIELALLVGAESKQWLSDLQATVAKLEKLQGKKPKEEPEADEPEEDDDEELAPKKKKKAKSVDLDDDADEEEETESDDEDDADEEEETPKKSTKKKKLTDDDVNTACKERVARLMESDGMDQKEARAEVVGILKKKFKVKNVAELEPEQYEAVIKVMSK